MRLLTTTLASLALLAALRPAPAEEEGGATYHFGTQSKHTNVTFVSEADLETIHGITNDVRGTARIDWEELRGSVEVAIPVASMDTRIEKRNEHMRSETWLDAARYPDVTFSADRFELKLRNRLENGTETFDATVKGRLTIHGVTREIEPSVTVTRLPAALAKRIGEGEWVRVATSFEVKLSDHGVKIPGGPVTGKVSDTWKIGFNCFATTVKPERK